MSYFNENMYRDIILDHVNNPRNLNKEHEHYSSAELKNPSCGDTVTVYTLVEDDFIKDVTYSVSGCSICSSSVSMMSDLLIGKTVDEGIKIIDNFNLMVTGSEFDEELLGEAVSLSGVSKMLPRIKCATLGYKAFLDSINRGDQIG